MSMKRAVGAKAEYEWETMGRMGGRCENDLWIFSMP